MRTFALDYRSIEADELIGGATTASDNVYEAFVNEFGHLRGHRFGSLVIETHGVGKTGVGVTGDVVWSLTCQLTEIRLHLCGTEGTVETYAEDRIGAHAGQKGIEGLS